MKVEFSQLTAAEIAALPRATAWRARKRGYLVTCYHERWANVGAHPCEKWEQWQAIIEREAKWAVYSMLSRGYPFPAYMGIDDLAQECVVEAWRISAKPDFESKFWRMRAMRLRLMQISKSVRGDRDRLRREELP